METHGYSKGKIPEMNEGDFTSDRMHHFWVDGRANAWDASADGHDISNENLKRHIFGDQSREGDKDLKQVAGLAKVTAMGDHLSIESHDGLTPHQKSFLNNAALMKGFRTVSHKTGHVPNIGQGVAETSNPEAVHQLLAKRINS